MRPDLRSGVLALVAHSAGSGTFGGGSGSGSAAAD
mgnify:CR=1 FL=1